MKPEGSFVALVTPFAEGAVDLKKIRELVEFHLSSGTNGFCPAATTGESPSLTDAERAEIGMTRGKALVFPGTGTYNTRHTIEQTRMARELGADGALVVTPYYNKPPQEGLYRHFEAVAKAVPIPIILYNVPGRTGVNLSPETTARLSKVPNIVALKDAAGSIEQTTQVRALCDLTILSGDDGLCYPMLSVGGRGVISVAANIVPQVMAEMCASYLKGDARRAQELHLKYGDLFRNLFLETSPIPVKAAMKRMGLLASAETRLPLCEMSASSFEKLEGTLKACGLI
jgi:4-hydroxy-tetrahydrodipicolinate synthase